MDHRQVDGDQLNHSDSEVNQAGTLALFGRKVVPARVVHQAGKYGDDTDYRHDERRLMADGQDDGDDRGDKLERHQRCQPVGPDRVSLGGKCGPDPVTDGEIPGLGFRLIRSAAFGAVGGGEGHICATVAAVGTRFFHGRLLSS